jgi:hypothetical protein
MIWLVIIVIVGLLILAPLLLFGLVIIVIVFFGAWGLTAYVVLQMAPDNPLTAIVIGFVAGIVAARLLVKMGDPSRINISR